MYRCLAIISIKCQSDKWFSLKKYYTFFGPIWKYVAFSMNENILLCLRIFMNTNFFQNVFISEAETVRVLETME